MKTYKFSHFDVREVSELYRKETGINPLAPTREMHCVFARHCMSHILYYDYNVGHAHIGRLTNRDRTSSNHSIKFVDEQMSIKNKDIIDLRNRLKTLFMIVEVQSRREKDSFLKLYTAEVERSLKRNLNKSDAVLFLQNLIDKFETETEDAHGV